MALQLRTHISTAETDYGTVLLDERSGQYWQLNATGALVVQTLRDGGTQAEAVATLVDQFEVDESQANADVAALLDGLHSAGLVTS
ncbi:MAG: lasso peptide biosynthesis PqqD family chaperone [Pseudonocardiaceae bacterium]|nr:lasso peptide biosynthesis PqqD family chaperone [Pseudonocardiaceae bacterium]